MNRLGEEVLNKYGKHMIIIEYNSSSDIKVRFDDGVVVKSRYDIFKKGKISHPYDNTIYNKGYIGIGKYKTNTLIYTYWKSMIKRVYDPIEHNRYPNYKDCILSEEWHNLQNFGKWFDENYYEIDNETMCLDKDILHKGNKIYSSNTCIFVPNRINVLFTNCKKTRGNYPIGVTKNDNNRFRARCNILDYNNKIKSVHLGYFGTPEEAFNAYKIFKENYIKEVADEYKDKIPNKLYEAMYNWRVDITD